MDFIKFVGTAGARFVVLKQLRSSGGTWITIGDTNLYLDPGPGALLRCISSRPKLDPSKLDGIILSHKHLDHSGDINVMIEAMTNGGFKKRGVLFAPKDALEDEPVVFSYIAKYLERIEVLKENSTYNIGSIKFKTEGRHIHPVETYGFNFMLEYCKISFLTDTRYFAALSKMYDGDLLIINVVRNRPAEVQIDHLSMDDVERIIVEAKPKLTILTHFGMTMLKAKPWEVAEAISKKTGLKVIAARDGMTINIEEEFKK